MRTAPAASGRRAAILGALLERDRTGGVRATSWQRLGDAALIDTRVLLAHRLGRDERGWPPPEDRYASDLLLAESHRRPLAARPDGGGRRDAPIPILLGGHTLVGPGLRLAVCGPDEAG